MYVHTLGKNYIYKYIRYFPFDDTNPQKYFFIFVRMELSKKIKRHLCNVST